MHLGLEGYELFINSKMWLDEQMNMESDIHLLLAKSPITLFNLFVSVYMT